MESVAIWSAPTLSPTILRYPHTHTHTHISHISHTHTHTHISHTHTHTHTHTHVQAGPAGSILGIVAYFFVFLIFESPHLMRPWIEALKLLLVVLLPLLLVGLLPFVDNFAHIGGLVFGFLLSGVFVPYWAEKKAWENVGKDSRHSQHQYNVLRKVKIAMIAVGIPLVVGLFLLFILLFYFYQETLAFLVYLNCVPFTETFCIDNLPETRDRSVFIV